jgi:hypothetical protein
MRLRWANSMVFPELARLGHVRPILLARTQAFFKANLVADIKSEHCTAAPWDAGSPHCRYDLVQGQI